MVICTKFLCLIKTKMLEVVYLANEFGFFEISGLQGQVRLDKGTPHPRESHVHWIYSVVHPCT